MPRTSALLLALACSGPARAADELPGWELVTTAKGVTHTLHAALAFTPGGKALLTTDLARVEVATGTVTPPPQDRFVRLLAVGPGDRVVTWTVVRADPTSPPDGIAVTAGGRMLCRVGEGEVNRVALSPDGSVLATSSAGKVQLWDVETGRPRPPLELRAGAVRYYAHALAFSPDGKSLAVGSGTGYPVSGSDNGAVAVWDVATGKLRRVLPSPESQVNALAWSPDGTRLAGGGLHSIGVRVWEPATGKETVLEHPGTRQVFDVAFSPDGRSVASCWRGPGAGDTPAGVMVWDAATGQARGVLTGPRGAVVGFAFAPNGRRVAAIDSYGTVRVWDAR